MERSRDQAIDELREMLERSGFYVAVTHGIRPSSFDLAARRDSLFLLVKVLKNIDAFDADEAERLRRLSELFPAVGLVVGRTSGASELEPGVVYMRYGIPIIATETLRDYVEKGLPPFLVSSPGGIYARIDGKRLRQLREERGLSLGALAEIARVSRRTIQLYEDGGGAEVDVVERIETWLDEPIVVPFDLFEPPSVESGAGSGESEPPRDGAGAPRRSEWVSTGDPLRDRVLRQLGGLGLQVVVTTRAPFDAFSRTPDSDPEILLTGIGTLRAAHHRAPILQGIARVAEGHAMFVVREDRTRASLEGLPILSMGELQRHRDPEALLEILIERSGA